MIFPCCVKLVYFLSAKCISYIRHSAISAAKHQHSDKSLKVKFKVVKDLDKGTHRKDVASRFRETKNTISSKEIKQRNLPDV